MEIKYKQGKKGKENDEVLIMESYQPVFELSFDRNKTECLKNTILNYEGKKEEDILVDLCRCLSFANAFRDREFISKYQYRNKLQGSREFIEGSNPSENFNTLGMVLNLILKRQNLSISDDYIVLCRIFQAMYKDPELWGIPTIPRKPDQIQREAADDLIITFGSSTESTEIIPPERRLVEVNTILRNNKRSSGLKLLYEYTCQLCKTRLELRNNEYYCEVHHIKPLVSRITDLIKFTI